MEETVTPITATTEAAPAPVAPGTVEEPTLLGPEGTLSPEAPKDESKPGEEAKKEEAKKEEAKVVPEKYEVTLPEGTTLDEGTLDIFTPIFKELGLDNEGVNKLVNAYVPLIQSTIDQQRQKSQEDFKAITDGWKSETMKELGVTAKEDLAACGKALNKFGSQELRELMQETGIGNHKEMVKFMVKIGKTISEDTLVTPKDAPINRFGPDPAKMYPSMVQ